MKRQFQKIRLYVADANSSEFFYGTTYYIISDRVRVSSDGLCPVGKSRKIETFIIRRVPRVRRYIARFGLYRVLSLVRAKPSVTFLLYRVYGVGVQRRLERNATDLGSIRFVISCTQLLRICIDLSAVVIRPYERAHCSFPNKDIYDGWT